MNMPRLRFFTVFVSLIALLITSMVAEESDERRESRKQKFTINEITYYTLDMSYGNNDSSKWDYLKDESPPVSFKKAHELIHAKLKAKFPSEVFVIEELDLCTANPEAHYRSRARYLIDGSGVSYVHVFMYVFMDGSVSEIHNEGKP